MVWRLLVRDDASGDATEAILRGFAATQADRVAITLGTQLGATGNFLWLIAQPTVGFVAFCDQDDVWLPEKLRRAVTGLSGVPEGVPSLFCAQFWVCDATLARRKVSAMPGFRHALVLNIAGGNAMVLNPAAARLVQAAAMETAGVRFHDWWVYQLLAGAGGVVILDQEPTFLYRQHRGNAVGSGSGWAQLWFAPRRVLLGSYAGAVDSHLTALLRSAHRMTPENAAFLHRFDQLRRLPMVARLRALRGLTLYRRGWFGTLARVLRGGRLIVTYHGIPFGPGHGGVRSAVSHLIDGIPLWLSPAHDIVFLTEEDQAVFS